MNDLVHVVGHQRLSRVLEPVPRFGRRAGVDEASFSLVHSFYALPRAGRF